MAIVAKLKAIKPAKMKEKELRLELLNVLRSISKDVRKDFEATVKTWEHKPRFEEAISLKGAGPQFLVGTDDEIYKFVDKGTKPHIIRPKKARALHFMGGYRAKTKPNVIGSSSGGASGPEVFTKHVNHPGTKARGFEEAIGKKWDKQFKKRMHTAMKKAAKKSGHAIN
jgi:hypothetical protein